MWRTERRSSKAKSRSRERAHPEQLENQDAGSSPARSPSLDSPLQMDNSQIDDIGFLDLMNVGSGEPNWSGTQNSSPISEQETLPTPKVCASAKSKSKPKKARAPSTKGKNWFVDEDNILIKTWANTSLDAVTGSDQKSSCYWERILEYYNTHKEPAWPERNVNSVNCRYTAISASTSMFSDCVQQILNKNESGRTLAEKQEDAHLLYIALDPEKKPFKLMHCYLELQKYPKWTTRSSQKKQKKTTDASPGSTSNDEEFGVCTDSLKKEQRPRGTKHEKERRAKAQASDGVKLSLESVWALKIEKDDIKEAAKSARYAQAFELQKKQIELQEMEDARKQFELEEKIMFKDTSGMTAAQKQFYKDKQDEILARRHHTSG